MSQLRDDVEYTTSWVGEPQHRGTLGIIYTCTFTLVLCVYTAVHLNIPPAGEPERWQHLRKAKWVLIAIFAPEAVLFTAIDQFHCARTFCREMTEIRNEQEGIITPRRADNGAWWKRCLGVVRKQDQKEDDTTSTTTTTPPQGFEPFSLTYGFYVVMGGLTVDVSDMYDNVKTVTLSPYRVLQWARESSWKDFAVSDTTIHDKSKADVLAKVLVVFQVCWLFLQCAARSVQGKPLTILEVHTVVHAVCAMFMYGFWFKKPLNIRDATVLGAPSRFQDQLALELINMPGSASPPFVKDGLSIRRHFPSNRFQAYLTLARKRRIGEIFGQPPRFAEYKLMMYNHAKNLGPPTGQQDDDHGVFMPNNTPEKGGSFLVPVSTATDRPPHPQGRFVCTLLPGQTIRCGLGPRPIFMDWDTDLDTEVTSWSLSVRDVLRWNRAVKAIPRIPGRAEAIPYLGRQGEHNVLETENKVSPRSRNFRRLIPRGALGSPDLDWLSQMGLLLISAAYGGIHLALWKYAFPSHIEMLLWKVSGGAMCSPLALYPALYVLMLAVDKADDAISSTSSVVKKMLDPIWTFAALCLLSFAVAFAVLYISSRVFIVLESFLSLRMVPVGVYEGVTWADYIPHF